MSQLAYGQSAAPDPVPQRSHQLMLGDVRGVLPGAARAILRDAESGESAGSPVAAPAGLVNRWTSSAPTFGAYSTPADWEDPPAASKHARAPYVLGGGLIGAAVGGGLMALRLARDCDACFFGGAAVIAASTAGALGGAGIGLLVHSFRR